MDNKFYTDHFEQFLKETVDDFRMYPSKRVWKSLYNNLHPGRKWPSLATCLLILTTMLLYSIANETAVTNRSTAGEAMTNTSTITADKNISVQQPTGHSLQTLSHTNTGIQEPLLAITGQASGDQTGTSVQPANNRSSVQHAANQAQVNQKQPRNNDARPTLAVIDETNALETLINNPVTTAFNSTGNLSSQFNEYSLADGKTASAAANSIRKPLVKKRTLTAKSDREWIEDFAFHNKPQEKWKGRLSYQLYATPSIGYRSMTPNAENKLSASSLNGPSNGGNAVNENYSFVHAPSWNLEAGGTFLLSISKELRLKAGMQLNYTRYKIHASEMDHPAFTSLLLNDAETGLPELVSRASSIANVANSNEGSKLNSSTYQISMPVGADFKLAGNSKFQWFAGATIQPSFVVGGNPYLISSDMKNYVYDASFLRRWNINTSVETFVSYQLNNGAVLNAGPQLRYQLLSTYDKRYTFDEKLYNIGIKLGITRNF